MIYARAQMVNGREVTTHVRIREFYTESNGFIDVEKEQIKVLEPGRAQIWRVVEDSKRKEEWALYEEWETDVDYIPLVTLYTQRDGHMVGRPPLMDLAHLNVAHWQSASDQQNILKVARFPMLACSDIDDDSPVTAGPNKVL